MKKIIVILALIPSLAFGWSLPADRSIIWQGNVGVSGGIPTRSTVCTTLTSTATAANITSALSSCPSGQVVLLSNGTYTISGTITVPANKTLRGADRDGTIIVMTSAATIISIGSGYTDCSSGGLSVTGSAKGATSIGLSSASTLTVGDHIYISEINDSSIPVNSTGTGGTPWYSACYSGGAATRNRAQIVKITSKATDTVGIDPPLYHAFAITPLAWKTTSYVSGAGIEDLTVQYNAGVSVSAYYANIQFQGAAESWVKNVKVKRLNGRGVSFYYDGYRNEVRNSYFTECLDHAASDTCYGVAISGSSANLIENNIFYDTANGIVLIASEGNAIGYNYMKGVHRDTNKTNWFWPDSWAHGSHNSYNLWEGNYHTGLNWDNYWGSNSNNTVFRSRITGKDDTITYDNGSTAVTDVASVIDSQHNNYMSIIGNVLGTTGFLGGYEQKEADYWTTKEVVATGVANSDSAVFPTQLRHQNYNYYTSTVKACGDGGEPGCQSGDTDTALPDSLYLAAKPSWYGSCTWPPVNPVGPVISDIPAKLAFEGSSCGTTTTYTIGGTITGLTGTIVLQNNGGDNLTKTSSTFTFDTPVNDGASYSVNILTQPSGQVCSVTSGSGTVSGANVTNIGISCVTSSSSYLKSTGTIKTVGGAFIIK